MKNKMGKWHKYAAVFILTFLMLSFSTTVKADSPFDTFGINGFGQTFYTQPSYEPYDVFAEDIYVEDEDGEEVYSPLNNPRDLFIDKNDEIYIADTGNDRIVHLNKDGELIRIISVPDNPLSQPSGIFVTEDEIIYVADTGNSRVVELDKNGDFVQEFLKPESKYIDDSFVYEPINMIVDGRGFVYVISRGTYQGIIQFSPEGEFHGFYGTNITEVDLMDRIRNIFYTKEQLSRQIRLLPNPIRNISIDKNGYVYTVSNDEAEQIKKLNIRGANQWTDFQYEDNINLRFLGRNESEDKDEESEGSGINITGITVDENGIVTVTDKGSSIIAQFNQDGDLLFFWGSQSTSGAPQKGVFKSPAAVDTNSKNQMFVLDDSLNFIQVLNPTHFGETVQTAFVLTEQGKYEESEEYWHELIRQNGLFTPAYSGLARSAFYNEDYEEAMALYKLAGDEEGYSDSFWQIRLEWFQSKFGYFAGIVLILFTLSFIWIKIQEKRRKKDNSGKQNQQNKFQYGNKESNLWNQLKHAFYLLRHPIDGFDEIRFGNMGGYLSSLIILGLVIILGLMKVFTTSFTFQPIQTSTINVSTILIVSVALWVSWVICQYLIGSIRHGQARFKDIFTGSAYALFPVVIIGLPLALLSNIMTLNEISIYSFINGFMILWCVALYFWMVMTLQNYSVGETIVSILLSIFSMIILWVLIFILVGLSSETLEFIITIYREVTM